MTDLEFETAIDVITNRRTRPLIYWRPNEVQEKWIKLVGTHRDGHDPRTKMLSAANKFLGKTCGSIAIVANIIWGTQSKWFQYPIYQRWPFPKNIWIVSNSTALREVIVPEMVKWFPKGRYQNKQGHKDYPYEWWTDTGFKIWLKSYDEDPENFEATLLGLALLSEPPPKAIYDAIPPRLSQGGIIMCEMTPLEGSGWLFEDLVDTGKAAIIYGEIEQGCREHSKRGRHPHERIQTWLASIRDTETLAARQYGRPVHYQGVIFKIFTDEIHIVPARELTGSEQIWFGIDPHGSKPPFCQWWALNEANELRCVLEFPKYRPGAGYETLRNTTLRIEDYCDLFHEIEEQFGFKKRVKCRVMDPFFGAKRYADTEYTVQQKYAIHGISCIFPPPMKTRRIQIGHEEMKEWLYYDLTKGIMPRMTWEAHCLNSIRAMKRYSIVEPRVKREHRDIVSETFALTEVWKHGCDVPRYIVLCNPTFEHGLDTGEYRGWRQQVLSRPKTDWNYLAH